MDIHVALVDRDVLIDGYLAKIHCHRLTVDRNGRVYPVRLAEFMYKLFPITKERLH